MDQPHAPQPPPTAPRHPDPASPAAHPGRDQRHAHDFGCLSASGLSSRWGKELGEPLGL